MKTERLSDGICLNLENGKSVKIGAYTGGIVRVTYPTSGGTFVPLDAIADAAENLQKAECNISHENGRTLLCFEDYCVCIDETGRISFCTKNGTVVEEVFHSIRPRKLYLTEQGEVEVIDTADGRKSFVKDVVKKFDRMSSRSKVTFRFNEGTYLYGLGSHPGGAAHFTDKKVKLYQHNLKISLPVVLSSKGWAVLLNARSDCSFKGEKTGMTFDVSYAPALDYYVVLGNHADDAVKKIRTLTGGVPMLPKWAYGYIQSKERYKTQEDVLQTARRFREDHIPIDCIVQDWEYWKEGHWGEKHLDETRYPDPAAMADELHGENIKLMVSVWPSFSPDSEEYTQFKQKGLLLCDDSNYDAFSEEAREMYFSQLKKGILEWGTDAIWCDSTEPIVADWISSPVRPAEKGNIEEFYKNIDPEKINTYSLAHCRSIYEHLRAEGTKKRVFNLTRSGFTGQSRYATVVWAGDTCARWDTFEESIASGLNYCATGEPYWTYDAGAFFVLKQAERWFWNGAFPELLKTDAYKEFYTRMLQAAVFLPFMRSHGTDCPREPWQFGEKGNVFYDAILSSIRMRYRLLPYIYGLAGNVCLDGDTMLRHLFFDFPEDETACRTGNQFMLGRALLVCPVTKPAQRQKRIYLPFGTDWYDFYTDKKYSGGSYKLVNVEMSEIPVYVRAGSIIPINVSEIEYSSQNSDQALLVYGGADGKFMYYDDGGDGYGYEQGEYVRFEIAFDYASKTLTFGKNAGKIKCSREFCVIYKNGGKELSHKVFYEGKPVSLKLE